MSDEIMCRRSVYLPEALVGEISNFGEGLGIRQFNTSLLSVLSAFFKKEREVPFTEEEEVSA